MHASGVAGEQAKNTTSRRHVMVGVIRLGAPEIHRATQISRLRKCRLHSMIADYVPAILAISAFATYVLQLWTGVAFAGWSGDDSLVERSKSPGPYWFVMTLQTLALIIIPVLILLNR
ncbi:hypothetical protein [Novipirellula herctigrandis]